MINKKEPLCVSWCRNMKQNLNETGGRERGFKEGKQSE